MERCDDSELKEEEEQGRMAQTSPGDLEKQGLENNHSWSLTRAQKSPRTWGKNPSLGKGEGTHTRGQGGESTQALGGGGLRIKEELPQLLGNNGKMRVSERMRESQKVSYLGR